MKEKGVLCLINIYPEFDSDCASLVIVILDGIVTELEYTTFHERPAAE